MLLLGVCFILYFLKLSNISENVQSFYKVSILKDFTKFTRKHLCRSIFFNKFAVLQPVTLFNKRLQCKCCLENFAKITSDPRHHGLTPPTPPTPKSDLRHPLTYAHTHIRYPRHPHY